MAGLGGTGGEAGAIELREVSVGECTTAACSPETLGLTIAEGQKTLAGLQRHLVQAQTEEYCRSRRHCQHCGAQRPLKDIRPRRLTSCSVLWRFVHPVSAPADAAWHRGGPSPRSRRSCPTVVRRSMNALSPRWALCCHTAGPAHCSENSSRSATLRRWRRSASGPCTSAPDWRGRRWHRRRPLRRLEPSSIALAIDGDT